MLGSELLLLSVGAETFGFLGSLSGVSVNELYSSALFSEADGDVEVYGVVPDMYSKLCNSIYNLFSCMSSSPTIETFADIMSNHNVKFGQFCRGTASGDVLARFDHKYCHVASHLDR